MIGATYKNNAYGDLAVLESIGNMGSVYYLRTSNGKLVGLSQVLFNERWTKQ